MRRTFHEHYRLLKKDVDVLWKSGLIVPDTNVLLNLYRYPEKARKELLKVLGDFQDQLWIPHRVGFEFHQRRAAVIMGQHREYGGLIDSCRKMLEKIEHPRRHPFVAASVAGKLKRMFKTLEKELVRNAAPMLELLEEDSILEKLNGLFEGRVGKDFASDQLDALKTEGDARYQKKIPPGFKDENKKDREEEGTSPEGKYGDFFIWKQLLQEAKAQGKGVLFITDDAKGDWWVRPNGKASPHPLLRKEFLETVGEPIHMYSTDGFMERAGAYSKREVDKEAIKEVKETLEELKAEGAQSDSFSLPLLTGIEPRPSIADALGNVNAADWARRFDAERMASRILEDVDRTALLRSFTFPHEGIAKALEGIDRTALQNEKMLEALGRTALRDLTFVNDRALEAIRRTTLPDLTFANEKMLEAINRTAFRDISGLNEASIAKAFETFRTALGRPDMSSGHGRPTIPKPPESSDPEDGEKKEGPTPPKS